jgi:hypothetical protein
MTAMAVEITTQITSISTTWQVSVKYDTPDTLVDPATFFAANLTDSVAAGAGLPAAAVFDSVTHTGTEVVGARNVYSFLAEYKQEETP